MRAGSAKQRGPCGMASAVRGGAGGTHTWTVAREGEGWITDYATASATDTCHAASKDVIYAAGQPPELPERASVLLSSWALSPSKKAITRHFTFPSFTEAWRFMSVVAEECKVRNHHPSWSNAYNKVTIEWTTHRPDGLSIKDVDMAEFCDRQATDMGLKRHGSPTN
ncbi:hypothetical protein ACEQ8H_007698 [Pleosporales sp. CAS-2024a]